MQSSLRMKKLQLPVLIVLLLASAFCVAQVSKGSISGNIADQTGAIVVGAEVKATDLGTGQVASTTSDSSGLFKLPLLAVGNYKLQVSKSGFKAATIAGVNVTAGVDTGQELTRAELVRVIRGAGRVPVERDTLYNVVRRYDDGAPA